MRLRLNRALTTFLGNPWEPAAHVRCTVKCEALLAFFVVSEFTKSFYEVLKRFWERFVESVLQKSRISTENKDQKRTDQHPDNSLSEKILNDFRKSENNPVTSLIMKT